MHDGKTPLEIALEREASGEDIDYCDECEYIAIVKGVGYCGISGKLLHPMMLERDRAAALPAGVKSGRRQKRWD